MTHETNAGESNEFFSSIKKEKELSILSFLHSIPFHPNSYPSPTLFLSFLILLPNCYYITLYCIILLSWHYNHKGHWHRHRHPTWIIMKRTRRVERKEKEQWTPPSLPHLSIFVLLYCLFFFSSLEVPAYLTIVQIQKECENLCEVFLNGRAVWQAVTNTRQQRRFFFFLGNWRGLTSGSGGDTSRVRDSPPWCPPLSFCSTIRKNKKKETKKKNGTSHMWID